MDLKESIQVPGTKIKLPMLEAIGVGAAVIGAYILIKGQAGSTTDTTETTDTTDTTNADLTSAYTGALETMEQQIADLQAAQSAAGQAGLGSGNGASLPATTSSPPPADIPAADVTATAEIFTDTINPKAIITQTGPGNFQIEMPKSKPVASKPNPKAPGYTGILNKSKNVQPGAPGGESAPVPLSKVTQSINPKAGGSVKATNPFQNSSGQFI